MTSIGPPNARPLAVIDPAGRGVFDPSTQTIVGVPRSLGGERLLWALPMNQSGLRRYLPDHPPSESCLFGLDFSFVIPFGVAIGSGTLSIFTNKALSAPADGDWVKGPVVHRGRALYAQLSGGVLGADYRLQWTAVDTLGNVWPRVALVLCAETS